MPDDFIPLINRLAAALQPGDARLKLAGLAGSAPAYVISRLLPHLPAPLLVVAADSEAAEEVYRELRFYSGSSDDILLFPPWDTAPFEQASPVAEIRGQRLDTLFRLLDDRGRVVVTTFSALCQKVLPKGTLGEVSHYLVTGEESDREALLASLVKLGYANVPLVEDKGSFAVRGGIIDIFPADRAEPVRIEFFGDYVETMRSFDPVTQRSLHPVAELVLLPSREVVLTDAVLQAFAPRLKERCDVLGISPVRRREYMEQLQSSIYPPGVEYLQPLFHPDLATILDYTGPGTIKVVLDPAEIDDARQRFLEELTAGEAKALERDWLFASPDELYLDTSAVGATLAEGRSISVVRLEVMGDTGETFRFQSEDNRDLRIEVTGESEHLLKPLARRISDWRDEGWRTVFVCHQQGQAERLSELLVPYRTPLALGSHTFVAELERRGDRAGVLVGDISRGFRLRNQRLAVIAEEELFGKRVKRRGLSEARKKQILTSLSELKPGDFMVHIDHGVGVYRGLQHLSLGSGMEGDFLLLEYAGEDKLYLPVDRINLVQRYVGAEGVEPRTDRLGGTAWEKAKGRARAAVEEMAEELLQIYAARQVQQGHAFSPGDELYREFEASFAFEETPDQLAAIDDVLQDMESTRPMDRLVCGDVGYGKTEVAMRGAFKAVMDGKQVAVLVPTTVLAQQHLETFSERFKAYPVKVEAISRFRTAKEQKEILAAVAKGTVDVVIGTHRLIQKDVSFKDLGLLIIDEEQRFGVAHKERLKKFRAVVDIMTLTATPIPRTLYMSMMGIRDLSIIDTPPVDRLSIKTFVARFNDELIREAILRELRRGGQVFFVHNRVQSIGAMAEHLQRIVPEARIAIGHGQMEEGALEQVMLGFMHGEYNVLLCSTIIESGLDIPNANTLIVNRADNFGLAQLYQLRGRVGRSRQRAYAYFLIPGEGAITADARERLKILQDLSELGAGFRIATHDLELRGAGDLLGGRQSGNIAAVGFELYTELLEEAISRLKGEDIGEKVEPEIKLRVPAFIPEDYVGEPNHRLIIYKKLTQAASEQEISEIESELVDRYGKLPLAAAYLMEVMKLRTIFKKCLISEAEFDGKRLLLAFHSKTPVSPDTIIALIREAPKKYQFTPDFRLTVELANTTFEAVLEAARIVLKRLI